MTIATRLMDELEVESEATRRVLERIPDEKLGWRPHETSMSLGQLGLHVAGIPGLVAEMLDMGEVPPPDFSDNPEPRSSEEILETLSESLSRADETLSGMDDDEARSMWRLVHDGQTLMEMPKAEFARMIMLNHWYHHRGQLCVYLRMLEIPVPAVYGVSRDENPFAEMLG